jgi:hypothetical protein
MGNGVRLTVRRVRWTIDPRRHPARTRSGKRDHFLAEFSAESPKVKQGGSELPSPSQNVGFYGNKVMAYLKRGLAVICLSALLAACASVVGDADAGPNPGGGFYDGPNLNVGHINPSGGFHYPPYTSIGQATR